MQGWRQSCSAQCMTGASIDAKIEAAWETIHAPRYHAWCAVRGEVAHSAPAIAGALRSNPGGGGRPLALPRRALIVRAPCGARAERSSGRPQSLPAEPQHRPRRHQRREDRPRAVSAMSTSVRKVVLAYSGGLDKSIILKWLQTTYGCEVVTF